jgi:DNA processing protein
VIEPSLSRTLDDAERIAWLRLIRSEGIGPRSFHGLVRRFGSVAAALAALPGIHREHGRNAHICTEPEALAELAAAAKLGVRYVGIGEQAYPKPLAATSDAPPLIGLRGNLEVLRRPMLAMVGSRNASALGLRFAERLARDLGEAGFAIVSGLARGIDARAHAGSLASGTVAVLAGGQDRIYPSENKPLLEQLLDKGAAVSEMPFSWEPRGRDFPRRNRIISGLALGVVVVEAARGSGSLITARFALEQGREVFAVPGSPLDPRAEGTNDLIRQGATLVTAAEHVTEALAPLIDRNRHPHAPPGLSDEGGKLGEPLWDELDGFAGDSLPSAEPAPEPNAPEAPAASPKRPHTDVTEQILAVLGPSPTALDDIVRCCGLPASAVRATLLELELAGRVARSGGDLVQLLP